MSARGARTRSALAGVPSPPDPGPDVQELLAVLDQATTALWLLDQIHYGELCFLTMRDPTLPCWISEPAARGMRPGEVKAGSEDMALKTLATALAEAKRLGHRRPHPNEA